MIPKRLRPSREEIRTALRGGVAKRFPCGVLHKGRGVATCLAVVVPKKGARTAVLRNKTRRWGKAALLSMYEGGQIKSGTFVLRFTKRPESYAVLKASLDKMVPSVVQ